MMQELHYIHCGDYYIPDIRLPEENRPMCSRWHNPLFCFLRGRKTNPCKPIKKFTFS